MAINEDGDGLGGERSACSSFAIRHTCVVTSLIRFHPNFPNYAARSSLSNATIERCNLGINAVHIGKLERLNTGLVTT